MARKKTKQKKYCIYCLHEGKNKKLSEIKKDDAYMIGLDRPYINLWFHRKCKNKIKDMQKYLIKSKKTWIKQVPEYIKF